MEFNKYSNFAQQTYLFLVSEAGRQQYAKNTPQRSKPTLFNSTIQKEDVEVPAIIGISIANS